MKFFRKESKHRLRHRSLTYKIFHALGKFIITFLVLLLVLLGFSQTATFRNFLRDEIISLAENELNGKLEIENIYGTLVSNISLRGVRYNVAGVDLIKAEGIYLSINPIALLTKTISIRNLILEEAEINIVKLEDDKWIFENIVKHPSLPDTTEAAKFEYDIKLGNFEIQRCTLRIKENISSESYLKSKIYETLNFSDLKISDLNLQLSTEVSLRKNTAKLEVSNFRFKTNAQNFTLRDFELQAAVTEKEARIKNFFMVTDQTNLNLIARIKDLNLFSDFNFEGLKDKYVEASLEANTFEFNDLKTWIPQVDMLKGNASLNMTASGEFGNLNVDKLRINLGGTTLNATAKILNLNTPEKLYITASIEKSTFLMDDVNGLLPLYGIPKFEDLGTVELSAQYSGEPTNFGTAMKIKSHQGDIEGYAKFNFNKSIAEYQAKLNLHNFNLKTFAGIDSRLNGYVSVEGKGFSPEEIHSEIRAKLHNSTFAGNKIDTSSVWIDAKNKIFDISLIAKNEKTDIALEGNFDFREKDLPKYNFTLASSNLDLAENIGLRDYRSNLNFVAKIRGESFDIDKMDSYFNVDFLNSVVNDVKIPESKIELSLAGLKENYRSIKLRSDFTDIDISGNFLINDLAETIPKNLQEIEKEVRSKLKSFNPVAFITDTIPEENISSKKSSGRVQKGKFISPPEKNIDISYNLNFRDFDLISIFSKGLSLKVDGNVKGVIKNNDDEFTLSAVNELDNFWLIDAEMSRRIKGGDFSFVFSKSNRLTSDRKMFAKVNASANQIIYNNQIDNFKLDAEIDPNNFYYRLKTDVDTIINLRSEGEIDLSKPTYQANIKSATVEYKKYKITNEGPLQFSFNKDKIEFEQFVLRRKSERIKLSGEIGIEGEQKLHLTANGIDLEDIVRNFTPENQNLISGSISLSADLLGNSDNPILNSNISLKSLSVNSNKLGELEGKINYQNKLLDVSVQYADTIYEGKGLSLIGKLPIDLTFASVDDRMIKDRDILVILSLDKFNLTPLQAFIPQLKSLSGFAHGDLSLVGTFDEPIMNGLLKVDNTILHLAQNNLKYLGSAEIQFAGNKIELTELKVKSKCREQRWNIHCHRLY